MRADEQTPQTALNKPVEAPSRGSGVSQFRLHKDANLRIPVVRMTKTSYLHECVADAVKDPSVLGSALIERTRREPCDLLQRVSITTNKTFDEGVAYLAQTLRLSGEEVVRLAVEYGVYVRDSLAHRSKGGSDE